MVRNILYLDDNVYDLEITRMLFSDYNVVCVDRVEYAKIELESRPYDILICDLILRGNDDILEFFKWFSSKNFKTYLVLTSGVEMLKSFNSYNGLKNYLGFVLKPITPVSIDNLVQKAA